MQTEEIEDRAAVDFPIEHFPDRSARWLFQDKQYVRGLVEIVASELVAFLDFDQLIPLNRSFISDTLREQESDLVFSVPFRRGSETDELLIYILLEHQSTVDPLMGFRVLFYMTQLWDAQRREWESDDVPGSERRLHPILPMALYTGERRWSVSLTLTGIMDIPDLLSRFVPTFDTLFLSVKETDEADLIKTGHPLGWLLTVLQKEGESQEVLSEALVQALSQLNLLDVTESEQQYRAIMYLLLLILHRRPAEEHNELLTLVERHTEKMEVSPMAQSMAEMLLERGKAQGIEQGKEQGIEQGIERGARETTIKNILSILNARFPQNNPQRIQQELELILDTDRLTHLHLMAVQAPSFEAFLQALD